MPKVPKVQERDATDDAIIYICTAHKNSVIIVTTASILIVNCTLNVNYRNIPFFIED